ncbi:uncharacterized protein BDR25DRAFT_338992 [Lindgomyces ingoldianus]|uniref:Uncharacterized protein n=1 Tax=Lindgomyces ingoldianus TaxID=673940 RepID=A0ACB6RDQ2_9PLEO|nr:uncharacterized protein BDR25DRAFT_338992 [Lindgomyces ingoldianus]KAF2476873.1 hypothetical protein BDR25DRAFT_338992 [Lindgomyces ingoldianus]
MATNVPVTLDTLITIKILFQGHNKKFKIPLRDLGAQVLPDKLRALLLIPQNEEVVFERYSDSAGAYVTLDSDKPQVYKTLFRAAKAKLKLRLRATLPDDESEPASEPLPPPVQEPLPTTQPSSLHRMSADTLSPQDPPQASPVIAHSPMASRVLMSTYETSPAGSTSRFSLASPLMANKPDAEGEAPVPHPFPARERFFNGLANASQDNDLVFRPKATSPQCSWVVFCNNCNQPMENEHFHCSICDHGDYDLCPSCVDGGIHCPGTGHWMVKRFVKNGCVVNSTTERVGPKPRAPTEPEMPGAFTDEKQPSVCYHEEPTRTCNSCVKVLPEKEFVTCTICDDYDLCMDCHIINKHGHHPGHPFKGATGETTLTALADFLCNAGRNVRHSAVCDGCEKFIYGVRHKCLNCPDWDFCSECMKSAKYIHPRHRFVPIYEPLAEPVTCAVRHYGIYCDGPLCKDKENLSYIEGVRYKCAVCHDTDFCANCEAIPSNRHNRTHPLIKFKTPVRNVTVTTMNEDKNGVPTARLGDQPARKSTATETTPVAPSANAATQVQTIVDMKPTEEPQPKPTKEKIEIRDLLTEPVQEKIKIKDLLDGSVPEVSPAKPSEELDAHFIRDTITDGTKVFAGFQFVQVWTLRNPGPKAWPAGCSVRHVGGDHMLNIDNTQPLSQSELADASESNAIGRPVEPGEEISFRIVMKAPKREGTAISYWRLKTADGTPFGHRLWCDIQVIPPPIPVTLPAAQPVTTVTASSETAETTGSSSNAPTMTAYERFQQAKLERLRAARAQYKARHDEKVAEEMRSQDDVTQRTARLQEEALERLRKMKLHLDEKEFQSRVFEKASAKAEREKMARIQKVRRAAVERLLEARRKEQENSAAAYHEKMPELEPAPELPTKQETAELPVEEKPLEIQTPREPEPQVSGMIFPQLEKESPSSSTHEAVDAKSEPQQIKPESAVIAALSEQSDADESFEDAESVDIRSISSDDEGFMTDEEYDILNASDEEMP